MKKINEETYPNIYRLMVNVARDIGAINQEEFIDFYLPSYDDFGSFEVILKDLSTKEFEALSRGEHHEVNALMKRRRDLIPIRKMIEDDWWARLDTYLSTEPFTFNVVRISDQKETPQVLTQTALRFREALSENLNLEMVKIPEGRFLMGASDKECNGALTVERPQHEVTVPQFYLGRYPVTQAQWRVVSFMPQVNHELKPDPSRFKGDLRPVEQVSWYEAVEFCDRLTRYTNRQYRLPTEAEWEYACRGGTTTAFHFGESLSTDYANYNGVNEIYSIYGPGARGEHCQETNPVEHFNVANAYGLCDMHGNVFEWCQDFWHDSYEGAPSDGSAWLTKDIYESRVLRGGTWNLNPRYCRSASRDHNFPDCRNNVIGFRVVCSSPKAL